MKTTKRQNWRLIATITCLFLGSFGTIAKAAFPERPVTVIVPIAPGTEVDWTAREYSMRLAEMWKVPVVVENRPGAGGDIGIGQAARAKPDGYTLLFTGGSFAITPAITKTSYDPLRSFQPVMHAGWSYFTLVVSKRLGVQTVAEFVSLARKKPGALNYASPGVGSVQGLAMELFKREAGIDVVHVPYKTASAAITDVAAGTVDAVIVSAPQVMDFQSEGRVKILMTISPERDPRIPEVPTAAEAGYPNYRVTGWSGFMLPAGTPDEIVRKINADLRTVRATPSFSEAVIKRFGGTEKLAGTGTPKELADVVEADLAMWRKMFSESAGKD